MNITVKTWVDCPFLDVTVEGDYCKATGEDCIGLCKQGCPLVKGVNVKGEKG